MTHIQWEWARGELTLKPLDAATSASQDFKRLNIFWENFVVQTDFAKFAKDNFTSKEIEGNLNLTGQLEEEIANVNSEISALHSMLKAKLAAAAAASRASRSSR